MTEGGGLLLVLAGDDRGYPPEVGAGGMVLRALGQGLDVWVCHPAGAGELYRRLARTGGWAGRLTARPCPGDPGTWLAALAGEITGGRHDLIVVHSVERLLAAGLGPELTAMLRTRPPGLHVVLAGSGELSGMADEADLVTSFERRK